MSKEIAEALNDQVVLVTGGTGSFGRALADLVLRNYTPRKFIIFSRNERRQVEMSRDYPESRYGAVRYFIGDVREKDRLARAMGEVDVVIHAACLRQFSVMDYNPLEAIKTNVVGTAQVMDAAIDCGVKKVLLMSSEKAVQAGDVYGATKLCAEKLVGAAGMYSGKRGVVFGTVRGGMAINAENSLIDTLLELRSGGIIPMVDHRLTRFWMPATGVAEFVLQCLGRLRGSEVFVPKAPSFSVMELATALAPECRTEIIGPRRGERLHEILISEDEARCTLEYPDHFVVLPTVAEAEEYRGHRGGKPCPDGFRYCSSSNDNWLSGETLKHALDVLPPLKR